MTWGATRILGSVRGAPFFIPFAIVFSSIGALIEEYTGQSIKQRVEMFIRRLGYNHLLKIPGNGFPSQRLPRGILTSTRYV